MEQTIEETALDIAGEREVRAMLACVIKRSLTVLKTHVGARAAAEELSREMPEIAERGYKLTGQFLAKVHDGLEHYVDQIQHDEPMIAIEQALQMILLILTHQTLRPRKHFPTNEEALTGMLVEAACGVLKVDAKRNN